MLKSLISSDSQRLIEIIFDVFVVQRQTFHEISHRKNSFGEVENSD